MTRCLFAAAGAALRQSDPDSKIALVSRLREGFGAGRYSLDASHQPEPIGEPGRPKRPALVEPRELVQRRLSTGRGRAALVHAVAHIEFNAINLALDAVYRFRDMPPDYYRDWLRVGDEEARHFAMLRERLRELGFGYGDFPAHNGLWAMCRETAHDVMVRMALVPRVLEARGLDVTPGMMRRLERAGDVRTVEVLRVILHEEEAHVAIGSHWFRHCCRARDLPAEAVFRRLLEQYMSGRIRGPFNHAARRGGGFTASELGMLESLDAERH